jgi:ribonuclease Z
LMYHEATFMHDRLERAIQTYHTTSIQAGEMAKWAEVKRLLLGHFSARYTDLQPLLEEARSQFPDAELAVEGMEVQL